MKALRAVLNYWGVFALVLLWQGWVWAYDLNAIVMPSPLGVLRDIAGDPLLYLGNLAQTTALAALGLLIGMAIGIGMAGLSWSSRILDGLLTPLGLIFSSVPVVALIPIIARLLGYDLRTVLAVVAIITFFPAFVFTAAGLRALPPGSADLFHVLGAGRLTLFLRLALPAALPNVMVALRLASSGAILSALVAEFLMGTSGLGALVQTARDGFNTERALGASLVATLISVVSVMAAAKAEQIVRERWT